MVKPLTVNKVYMGSIPFKGLFNILYLYTILILIIYLLYNSYYLLIHREYIKLFIVIRIFI